jgi:hypothetical protein
MSRDRHADRLHARLAGGATLSADERRHVATCADCQRAVADVDRLDDQLTAAAAPLATEHIPDADLEPLPVPGSGWTAPLSAVVAVGLVGIVIGFWLGELRPPTGADATPTPQAVAEESAAPSPSPSPSVAPAPSPPPPSPSPDWLPLATGGEPCADGEMGFSIVVPEGWYANLHQGSLYANLREGNLMACAFLAPQPFDALAAGRDPEFDAPIRLTTSVEATPPGTVVEQDGDAWTVDRAGETWLVHVVELIATFGDDPAYLHVASHADDKAATLAFETILDGLTIFDPIMVDPAAVSDADDLFADADVCSDLERGVNVILPDEWWTNTALDDLQPCSYYAPERFGVGEARAIPDGVAITLEVRGSDVEAAVNEVAVADELIGIETLVVDNRAAIRSESLPPDADVYQYVVELDSGSLVLTLEGERSDDYERDKAVLDEMIRRLIISPTPAAVLAGGRLPSCGWDLVERTPEGDRFDVEARLCLLEDYEAGEPAEMVRTGPTVEGGIVREIFRVLGPDEIEFIIDWTHDPLGPGGWQLMRCAALEQIDAGGVTGAVDFIAASCEEPVRLDP